MKQCDRNSTVQSNQTLKARIGKKESVKHAKQMASIKNEAKLFFEGDFEVKSFKILSEYLK